MTIAMTRARRCELLAAAPLQQLLETADACLDGQPAPVLLSGPDVGTVVMTVREPVEASRFHLGDVLVTQSTVEHRSIKGWSMRMGDDRPGALAAAICDAEVEAAGHHAAAVEQLCNEVEHGQAATRAEEWHRLEPTVVRFEEMGE